MSNSVKEVIGQGHLSCRSQSDALEGPESKLRSIGSSLSSHGRCGNNSIACAWDVSTHLCCIPGKAEGGIGKQQHGGGQSRPSLQLAKPTSKPRGTAVEKAICQAWRESLPSLIQTLCACTAAETEHEQSREGHAVLFYTNKSWTT